MTQVIILDFDRTIATLVIDWDQWRKHVRDLILQFEPDSTIELIDIRHAIQNDLIQKYGPDFREQLNQCNEQLETTLVTAVTINKTVLEFIKNTDKKLYCWSSNSRKTLDRYFKELNISEKFTKTISREDTYFLKPDNEGFKFIHDSDIPLDQYLFVGDSEPDRIAADRSGIHFLHVDDFKL